MPIHDIKSVMESHVDELMAIPGVTGVALGKLDDGTPCIMILIVAMTDELAKKIPGSIEGHPTLVVEGGEIEPMPADDS